MIKYSLISIICALRFIGILRCSLISDLNNYLLIEELNNISDCAISNLNTRLMM